jgi:Raf kinase inhibitor-like YbhB/YbcL family protein
MEIGLSLSSSAFAADGIIPAKYTCDGDRLLSPPLTIRGVPEETRSLVLIMDDPDIPAKFKKERGIEFFVHWVVFNIPPGTTEIPQGATLGVLGSNSRGEPQYTGPCPPPEYEPTEHRYFFTLYALTQMLKLPAGATKEEVIEALTPLLLEKAELMGRYTRV